MRCLLLLSMLLFPLYDIVGQSYFGMMTYNCENAFDTIHDEGCDDLEYTPNGLNSWKRDKFYNKIRNIEKEDELSVKFPRFKIHDDSSCIYLDIYRNK